MKPSKPIMRVVQTTIDIRTYKGLTRAVKLTEKGWTAIASSPDAVTMIPPKGDNGREVFK